MLRQIVIVVAGFGIAFVASGVCWRYVCPQFVDLPDGNDLALLTVRDGVAAGMVAIGLGITITAFGTLELLADAAATSGAERTLVVLATILPIREAGGVLMASGFSLVLGSVLAPDIMDSRRELRE